MDINMNDYLDMFLEESEEHIQTMSNEMLRFEQEPKNLEIVNVMFRSAHTLKGMAGSMGFEKTQKLTHTIENMMDDIRNTKNEPDEETIEFMFKGIERLEKLINEIKEFGKENSEITDLIKEEEQTKSHKIIETFQFEITSLEEEAILEAKEQGLNIFYIKFELIEGCVLKTIRTNMFFKEINTLGDILLLKQSDEEIEKENFNGKLDFIFITSSTKDKIQGLKNKLSEVDTIDVLDWSQNENIQNNNQTNSEQKTFNTVKEKTNTETEQGLENTKEDPDGEEKRRKQSTFIKVNLEKIDYLMGLFEEFIVEKGRLKNIATRVKDKELGESLERLNRNSTEMQTSLLSMRMIPLDTIFNRFPRMVRNISKELEKNIEFLIEGEETELDRTVVEELGDPLVHLLRNSLDHGIELPKARSDRGKPEQGTILLKAYHKGNDAIIELSDDGNGINVEKIKEKLFKQQVFTEKEIELQSDEQIIQHIFSSGMSTAEKITNISGRGVGLDVVKTKIESLGGTVKVETTSGIGTKFVITLPLTLSIIQALLVREKDQIYAVPLSNIMETILVEKDQIHDLLGTKVLHYRKEIYNTHNFNELFIKNKELEGQIYALIIRNSYQKYALLVNEIIGQQEIVIKPLQGYTKNLSGITGATVLGDGSVAFVLDINYFQK